VVRPRKRRRLERRPQAMIYKPAGIPLDGLRQVTLLAEELEALRLTDLEGLAQSQAAEQMGVSRSTFQRTLERARRQVALALVEGQALALSPEENGTRINPDEPG
jgi:predicted DNA-binding protein (UPF0251 family)